MAPRALRIWCRRLLVFALPRDVAEDPVHKDQLPIGPPAKASTHSRKRFSARAGCGKT